MGLVRSFRSERECGQTVGQTLKYGLLRQEEQRAVLNKLGGHQRKRSADRRTSPRAEKVSTPFDSKWQKQSTNRYPSENLIWKQMCRQQSILKTQYTTTTNTAAREAVLPVAKHVDHTLIESWSTSIALRASRKDYLPQAILRSITNHVRLLLQQALKDHLLNEKPK